MSQHIQCLIDEFVTELNGWVQAEYGECRLSGWSEEAEQQNDILKRAISLQASIRFRQFRHTLCDLVLLLPFDEGKDKLLRYVMNAQLPLSFE